MMSPTNQPSFPQYVSDDLTTYLRSGMYDEFAKQFKKAVSNTSHDAPFELAARVNQALKAGGLAADLRLVVSQENSEKTVTILGRSIFFGDSWPVSRSSFYL
ncbi:MAG: hypothetical protein K2Z81_06225 [Cyanobacteria bacterium]|nr:hypothetical protein [Cyanobacteriota bacterium]